MTYRAKIVKPDHPLARPRFQGFSGVVGPGEFVQDGDIVSFVSATVSGMSFANLRTSNFYSEDARFIGCDFREARFLGGNLGPVRPAQSVFVECSFDGVDLRHIEAYNSRFERCSFRNAQLDSWLPDFAEFVGCTFAGRIYGARFSGSPARARFAIGRTTNDFLDNDFSETDLVMTSFEWGIDLSRQKLPQGEDYLRIEGMAERLDAAREAIAGWADPGDRKHGELLLTMYGRRGLRAQQEVFTRRYGFSENADERQVADRFWELIGVDR